MPSDDRKAADIYRDMVREVIAENDLLRARLTEMEAVPTMTDDDVLSLAAANAQIRRLRADNARFKELLMQAADTFKREQAELRARITELEAEQAFVFGTLEKPTPHE